MTKNTLLAATALTAMVFAGAASASEISAATVGTQTPVLFGANQTAYTLASNAVQPATATNFTSTTFNVTQVAGTAATPTPLAQGQYDFTFVLGGTGSPVFATAVQAGDVTRAGGGGTCAVTSSVINGGGAGQAFVTVRSTFDANCVNQDRATGVTLARNITIASAGTVTVSGTIANVGTLGTATGLGAGTPPVAGTQTSAAKTVVQTINPYALATTADTVTTSLSLNSTPVYSALSTGAGFDAIIGTAGFSLVAAPANATAGGIYAGLAENALPATNQTIVLNATGGDFTRLNATIGGVLTTDVAGTPVTSTRRVAFAPGLAQVVLVADAGTPAQQIATSPIGFSATVTPAFDPAVTAAQQTVTLPSAPAGALQSLTLEGTNFVAPWVQMQNTSSQSIIRISNQGTSATGPITLTLRAPNAGTVNTSCTLTPGLLTAGTLSNGGIPANSFISINGNTLANACFGTTAQAADVQVTIQANATDLTAKVRLVNASGNISETSLGRLRDGSSVVF